MAKPTRFTVTGAGAIRSTYAFGTAAPDEALVMTNCYPDVSARPGPQPIVPRPGLKGAPDDVAAVTSGTHNAQILYEFRQLDGTVAIVGVWNGIIHTYDSSADTWTAVVTAANFATAGITRSTSGRWFAATITDLMVISDGTNLPFTWDGTAGAGGLVSLTNAAVAYGKPTIHAGKVVFIKNSERDTFIWSEEFAPNTGYEAGGYNNAWTLKQNGSSPLVGIQGSNAGLFYFRTQGVGVITGDVTPDFATSATDDAIAEHVGLGAPDAFLLHEGSIWFLDERGRPWVLDLGGGLTPLWADNEAGVSNEAGEFDPILGYSFLPFAVSATPEDAVVSWNPVQDLIMFRHGVEGPYWFGYSPYTRRLVTAWQVSSISVYSSTAAVFPNGTRVWFHGLSDSHAGYFVDGWWEDLVILTSTHASYTAVYVSAPVGWTVFGRWAFDRLDLVAKSWLAASGGSTYLVQVLTSENPYIGQSSQSITYTVPAGITQSFYAQHEPLGINAQGRWACVRITFTPLAAAGSRPNHAIYGWSLRAETADDEPEVL